MLAVSSVIGAALTAMPVTASAADGDEGEESASPVELVDRRTATSEVYQNADGTLTLKEFAAPVHVRQGGEWVDVDYDLVKRPDGSYAPKAAPADIVVGGGGSKQATEVTFADGESVGLSWPTALPEPSVDGGVATYKLSDSTDLVVAITGTGVATRIRLNEAPAASDPVWKLGLRSDSLDVDQVAPDALEFNDSKGEALGATTAMVAWDASTDDGGDPDNIVPVEADLSTTGTSGDITKHELELSAPEAFLNDPNTQYPVTIDPDIDAVSSPRSTWMRKDTPASTSNVAGQYHRLLIGRVPGADNTNPAMSYLAWSNSQLSGKAVLSAEVGVYQYDAGSCAARAVNAHPLSGSFSNTTEYANRPDANLGTGDSVATTANPGSDNANCTSANAWVKMNVTKMAQSWATGRYTNYGMRLNVPTDYQNDALYSRRVCSGKPDSSAGICTSASTVPYLKVRYNGPPNTAAVPTTPTTTVNGVLTSRSTKPAWTTSATDAEQSAVKYDIQVHSSTAGTAASLATSCVTAQVASGAAASCTPTTALVSGKTYYARAKATDNGGLGGAWSGYRTVKIDTSAPEVVEAPTWLTLDDCDDCEYEPYASTTSTPTLSSDTGSAQSGTVQVDFEITRYTMPANGEDDAEAEPVATVVRSMTASTTAGQQATAKLPAALEDGSYSFRTKVRTSQSSSVWSEPAFFDVTTEVVPEPQLPSTPYQPDPQVLEDEAGVQDVPVDVTLESGDTLKFDDGGDKVGVFRGGEAIGWFDAPMATDNSGTPQNTEYKIVDNTLRQIVRPSPDAVLPIVTSPIYRLVDRTTEDATVEDEALDLYRDAMLEGDPEPEMSARSAGKPYVRVPLNYRYWPQNTSASRNLHDYCTKSPNTWFKANFRGPCAVHDMCIEGRRTARTTCDRNFLTNLRVNCRYAYASYDPRRSPCYRAASVYYAFVTAATFVKKVS